MIVLGVEVDDRARCAHWRGPTDVIAVKFSCCDAYYACYECHDALAEHKREVWPKTRFDVPAALCGECRAELSITEYLTCGYSCPRCSAGFNPGCAQHYERYFEL